MKKNILFAGTVLLVLTACTLVPSAPTASPAATVQATKTPTDAAVTTATAVRESSSNAGTNNPVPGTRVGLTAERLAELDAYVVNAPASVAGSVKDIAAYLAVPARNDFEKSRLIFRWIDQNVSYDAEAFFSRQLGDQRPEAVLKTRMAVCGGYSALFEALAKAMGLEVVTIDGWAKGYGYDLNELNGESNHAWNAIKVDGAWYLVDSTWGAGSLTKTGEFVRSFNPYYWLTPPEQFIYNHLPSDSRWQLLATPVSKKEYADLPMLSAGYFSYGLQLPSGTGAINRVESQVTLTLSAPSDVMLTASVKQNGVRLDDVWTFTQRNDAQYEVYAVFPEAGSYDLVIFAKRASETGDYKSVVLLGYEASRGQPAFAGFPQTYKGFAESGAYLYFPKQGGFAPGSVQIFKLSVPRALDVQVIVGDAWRKLAKQGDLFEGSVTITATPVKVCASFDTSNSYNCLLAYE